MQRLFFRRFRKTLSTDIRGGIITNRHLNNSKILMNPTIREVVQSWHSAQQRGDDVKDDIGDIAIMAVGEYGVHGSLKGMGSKQDTSLLKYDENRFQGKTAMIPWQKHTDCMGNGTQGGLTVLEGSALGGVFEVCAVYMIYHGIKRSIPFASLICEACVLSVCSWKLPSHGSDYLSMSTAS